MNTKLEAARGRLIQANRHVRVEKALVDRFLKHAAEIHTDPKVLNMRCALSFRTLAYWVEVKASCVHDIEKAQELAQDRKCKQERKQEFQQAQLSLFGGDD